MRRSAEPRPSAPAATDSAIGSAGPSGDAHSRARSVRKQAVTEVRRSLVLEAARSAFFELGLEGTSVREIARRAGYTPGAIYSYYASKEEVYGALLGESLERLNACVGAAASAPTASRSVAARRRTLQASVHSHASAFFDFYRQSPRDLDLGFYLFHGLQPRGLTPALNKQLNARLQNALAPIQSGLTALGLSEADARCEVAALFAHIVGLLLLSHTGRIRMFHQEPVRLFERYVESLLARVTADAGVAGRAPNGGTAVTKGRISLAGRS